MQNISDFLEKFRKIIKDDSNLRETISLVIKQNINVIIKEKDIEIKNNIIYLKENNYIKNEIFFKKEKILNDLNNCFEKRKFKDIF